MVVALVRHFVFCAHLMLDPRVLSSRFAVMQRQGDAVAIVQLGLIENLIRWCGPLRAAKKARRV